jgi:hypothetical protein
MEIVGLLPLSQAEIGGNKHERHARACLSCGYSDYAVLAAPQLCYYFAAGM